MIHWNINPEAISAGGLHIRWYGIFFMIAFLVGYQIVKRAFTHSKISHQYIDPLFTYVIVATIVGARLGHTLFYEPELYLPDPIRILKLWEGGLASHGAVLGVLLSMYLFSKKLRSSIPDRPALWLLDRMAIPFSFGGGLVRLGNLMNSEIIGKPTSSSWGFIFTRVDHIPRHPAQLYEAISYFILAGLLALHYRKWKENEPRGVLTGFFMIGIFSVRFLIEFFKEPQVSAETALWLDFGQLYSLPLIAFGGWLIGKAYRRI